MIHILADQSTGFADVVIGLTWLLPGLSVYLVPTFVAWTRRVRNFGSIVVVNIFLVGPWWGGSSRCRWPVAAWTGNKGKGD